MLMVSCPWKSSVKAPSLIHQLYRHYHCTMVWFETPSLAVHPTMPAAINKTARLSSQGKQIQCAPCTVIWKKKYFQFRSCKALNYDMHWTCIVHALCMHCTTSNTWFALFKYVYLTVYNFLSHTTRVATLYKPCGMKCTDWCGQYIE